VKIRERGPAGTAIKALVFLERHVWGLVSVVAIALIVFVFGPRQTVAAIIVVAAVAVAAMVAALMSWSDGPRG
jgi:uncharacterized membrane protein YuzA (DUF378 family)